MPEGKTFWVYLPVKKPLERGGWSAVTDSAAGDMFRIRKRRIPISQEAIGPAKLWV